MITTILQFFGRFLLWMCNFFHSYALSLIIFTLLTRLVLFPLSFRGKRSMMQMNALNSEVQKLQKQFGKDKDRLNEETQKLYEREGVNPMSGCLWSLLPLPILMALYYIIRRPLLYMMALTEDQVTAAIEAVQALGYDLGSSAYQEIHAASLMQNSDVMAAVQAAVGDGADKLQAINFNMLGIDLAQTPTLKFWETFDTLGVWCSVGLFLIPLIVTALNFGYTQLSQRTNAINGQQAQANSSSNASMRMMNLLMPLMYLWFGFIMPAGMCVYMAFSAIFSALQEIICAQLLKKDFAKMEAEREQRELEAKEAEKKKKEEIAARRAAQEEEAKKNRGKKRPKKPKKGVKDQPTQFSRVGVRAYARGRAYDPDRYPVTPYRDPADVLDEQQLEAEYAKRGHKLAQPEPEPEDATPEALTTETPEAAVEAPAEAAAPTVDTPAQPTKSADELFAEIQQDAAPDRDGKPEA
ncbi:MAG: YidC/Oxa1 family membrane protein insertase [Clostridiales bacterium]|nr:YidC/Oxa1 family membrane protein insertase [Clostridiales bacterium]